MYKIFMKIRPRRLK